MEWIYLKICIFVYIAGNVLLVWFDFHNPCIAKPTSVFGITVLFTSHREANMFLILSICSSLHNPALSVNVILPLISIYITSKPKKVSIIMFWCSNKENYRHNSVRKIKKLLKIYLSFIRIFQYLQRHHQCVMVIKIFLFMWFSC